LLILSCFFASSIGFLSFYVWERHARDPLLDLTLLRDLNVSLALITSFVKFFVEAGLYFLIPFYLLLTRGTPAMLAGLLLVLPAVVQMIVSPLTATLTRRFGSRLLYPLSMALTSASCALFVLLTPTSHYGLIVVSVCSIGLAKGLFIAPNRLRLQEHSPAQRRGAVNGLLETMTRAGVALGICFFEAVFSQEFPKSDVDFLYAPKDLLMRAFHSAFRFGAWISLIGLATSLISFRKAPSGAIVKDP
jgi:MFS family permease